MTRKYIYLESGNSIDFYVLLLHWRGKYFSTYILQLNDHYSIYKLIINLEHIKSRKKIFGKIVMLINLSLAS